MPCDILAPVPVRGAQRRPHPRPDLDSHHRPDLDSHPGDAAPEASFFGASRREHLWCAAALPAPVAGDAAAAEFRELTLRISTRVREHSDSPAVFSPPRRAANPLPINFGHAAGPISAAAMSPQHRDHPAACGGSRLGLDGVAAPLPERHGIALPTLDGADSGPADADADAGPVGEAAATRRPLQGSLSSSSLPCTLADGEMGPPSPSPASFSGEMLRRDLGALSAAEGKRAASILAGLGIGLAISPGAKSVRIQKTFGTASMGFISTGRCIPHALMLHEPPSANSFFREKRFETASVC